MIGLPVACLEHFPGDGKMAIMAHTLLDHRPDPKGLGSRLLLWFGLTQRSLDQLWPSSHTWRSLGRRESGLMMPSRAHPHPGHSFHYCCVGESAVLSIIASASAVTSPKLRRNDHVTRFSWSRDPQKTRKRVNRSSCDHVEGDAEHGFP